MPKKPATVDDDRETVSDDGEYIATPNDGPRFHEEILKAETLMTAIANTATELGTHTNQSDDGLAAWDGGDLNLIEVGFVKAKDFDTLPQTLQNLITSGIVIHDSGKVVWRTGHLEHIANQFAGDPETTERNYADDLAVARVYSAETWERMTSER